MAILLVGSGSACGGSEFSARGEASGGPPEQAPGGSVNGGTSASGGDGASVGGSKPDSSRGGDVGRPPEETPSGDGGSATGGAEENEDSGGSGGSDTDGPDPNGGTGAGGTNSAGASTGGSNTGGSNTAGSNTAGSNTGGSSEDAGGSGGIAGGGGTMIGGCENQLLANADFDAGPTASWREETTLPEPREIILHRSNGELAAEDVAPDSGDFLARLGGIEDNEWSQYFVLLRQDVTIPEDAHTLTLTGRYWIKTEDDPDIEYDEALLEFEDADETIWPARRLTNRDHTTGWTSFQHSTSDLDRLRGRTIVFLAYSRTDFTGKTTFFLDSLRVEARCEP
ncbi:MAG TPA: hypothetical protein VGK73_19005 [Polyangiaceae bacterium]